MRDSLTFQKASRVKSENSTLSSAQINTTIQKGNGLFQRHLQTTKESLKPEAINTSRCNWLGIKQLTNFLQVLVIPACITQTRFQLLLDLFQNTNQLNRQLFRKIRLCAMKKIVTKPFNNSLNEVLTKGQIYA